MRWEKFSMQVRENFNMAKSIMIQGTMSNVGKSLLAGGLCRVLKEDGIKVAPFKSQNMALNSFITADGLEMGRAQVMQAEAAMIRPEVYMNPILLKPTSDVGSQVIVNGEVAGVMPAMEYFRKKKEYIPAILEAYHKLEEKYDVMVIEGSGSPAEINLKQNDIVNMGLAELVDAPVLLAGDIDRVKECLESLGLDLIELELINNQELVLLYSAGQSRLQSSSLLFLVQLNGVISRYWSEYNTTACPLRSSC